MRTPTARAAAMIPPRPFAGMTAIYREAATHRYARLMVLLFDILFPLMGLLIIAVGVLTAVFNERWTNMQNKWNWTWRAGTPEFTRGFGAIVAFFGVIFLTFSLVILFAGKQS
jgi:hypothetical protein